SSSTRCSCSPPRSSASRGTDDRGPGLSASVAIVGNVNVDLIARPVTELPPPGEEWHLDAVDMRVGGSAAITALALAKLGAAARLVGCVGDDALGALLLEQLREASVATDE